MHPYPGETGTSTPMHGNRPKTRCPEFQLRAQNKGEVKNFLKNKLEMFSCPEIQLRVQNKGEVENFSKTELEVEDFRNNKL